MPENEISRASRGSLTLTFQEPPSQERRSSADNPSSRRPKRRLPPSQERRSSADNPSSRRPKRRFLHGDLMEPLKNVQQHT
ncbi:hypothetical protein QE152_g19406 [Popillia japonica]|uniref:Uncharacterized protein n=1 Tax=Popillia japonica TaxID=7064 RepID=A0AAW1KRX4_POPJA